jgi:hypothetical protein
MHDHDEAALFASSFIGDDPERVRRGIADIERQQRTWRYRLFAPRWRKEADRCLLERLKARGT